MNKLKTVLLVISMITLSACGTKSNLKVYKLDEYSKMSEKDIYDFEENEEVLLEGICKEGDTSKYGLYTSNDEMLVQFDSKEEIPFGATVQVVFSYEYKVVDGVDDFQYIAKNPKIINENRKELTYKDVEELLQKGPTEVEFNPVVTVDGYLSVDDTGNTYIIQDAENNWKKVLLESKKTIKTSNQKVKVTGNLKEDEQLNMIIEVIDIK